MTDNGKNTGDDVAVPISDGPVPDKVLEELLAAFAGDDDLATDELPVVPDVPTAGARLDLDDPAIDELLGIGAEQATPGDAAVESDGDTHDDGPPTAPLAVTDVPPPVPESPAAVTPNASSPRRTIRIGADDDDGAMDAVYLDEEGAGRLRGETDRQTEASVERTTIRIGDDEIEGMSGGIPLATGPTSMDPRLRARRIAVKRALGRKRLKWVLIVAVVVILVTAVLAVLGSSLFRVQNVEVSGRSGNTTAAIDAAIEDLRGTPVLLVDTHAVEDELEKNPWIRTARVATDFPHGASIEVVERVPIATYPGTDGRWRIIDVQGVVLDVIANRPLAFMEINGPGADAEAGGSAGAAVQHAAELVDAMTPAVRTRTQRVLVSDTGELSLQFDGAEVQLGAAENLLDKLTWLETVIKSGRVEDCSVINVTTRDVGCVQK